MKMKRNHAFTLIEILIVIAIIALLAAILFPVFSRARERARQASCQSNLKQIGMAIMQYTSDNDERLPQAYYWFKADGSTAQNYDTVPASSWRVMIDPYVKSHAIFTCPSNPDRLLLADDGNTVSYAANACNFSICGLGSTTPGLMGKPSSGTLASGAKLSWCTFDIQNPSQVWMISENTQQQSRPQYVVFGNTIDVNEFSAALYAGHSGRANWLFVDGHVKALKPTQTGTPLNMWIPNATGPAPTSASVYILDKLRVADQYWETHS
jgi:prepilin-type N-terminal cleavage/methylation domain-containing protein/prepilin-type processing-associated H-X9-DG protein